MEAYTVKFWVRASAALSRGCQVRVLPVKCPDRIICKYLGRHVVGCAAECVCRFVEVNLELAHSEIGYADVAVEIQKYVVQLEISAIRILGSLPRNIFNLSVCTTVMSLKNVYQPYLTKYRPNGWSDEYGEMILSAIYLLMFEKIDGLPVNDAELMQEREGADDFRSVKSSPPFVETAGLLNVEHEIATVQILHHEEQVRLRGKYGIKHEQL